jgi:hypothetical protein
MTYLPVGWWVSVLQLIVAPREKLKAVEPKLLRPLPGNVRLKGKLIPELDTWQLAMATAWALRYPQNLLKLRPNAAVAYLQATEGRRLSARLGWFHGRPNGESPGPEEA